jgi:hypothetical protein
MRWTFIFSADGAGSLVDLNERLHDQGYTFAGMRERDAAGEAKARVVMEIWKVEKHTPDSLHSRMVELAEMAKGAGALYEAMTVATPDGRFPFPQK